MLQQPVDETSALQRLPPAGSGHPAPRRVFPSKGLRRSEERCEVPSGRRPAEPLRHGNRSLGLACVDAGETGGREPARDNPPDALAAVPRSRSLFEDRQSHSGTAIGVWAWPVLTLARPAAGSRPETIRRTRSLPFQGAGASSIRGSSWKAASIIAAHEPRSGPFLPWQAAM